MTRPLGMIVLWILFVGSLVVLPAAALLALRWAVRTGQLRDFQKGALLVFDDEEPVGQVTDHFPGKSPGSIAVASLPATESRFHPSRVANDRPSGDHSHNHQGSPK